MFKYMEIMKKINRLLLFLALFAVNVSFAQDGTPDTSFDGDGKVTTTFGVYDSSVSSLAMQSDGKIIAVGTVSDYTSGYSQFALARYNQDGSLDATFGAQGTVVSDFLGLEISAFSMNIQLDD